MGTVWGLHFRLLFFHNSLKYLDINWWRRRESNLRPKNNFPYIFKLLAEIIFSPGTAWGLTCHKKNYFGANGKLICVLDILTV